MFLTDRENYPPFFYGSSKILYGEKARAELVKHAPNCGTNDPFTFSNASGKHPPKKKGPNRFCTHVGICTEYPIYALSRLRLSNVR